MEKNGSVSDGAVACRVGPDGSNGVRKRGKSLIAKAVLDYSENDERTEDDQLYVPLEECSDFDDDEQNDANLYVGKERNASRFQVNSKKSRPRGKSLVQRKISKSNAETEGEKSKSFCEEGGDVIPEDPDQYLEVILVLLFVLQDSFFI